MVGERYKHYNEIDCVVRVNLIFFTIVCIGIKDVFIYYSSNEASVFELI